MKHRWFVLTLMAACLAPARVAYADEMTKEAEARFQEGLEFAKGGRYEEARAKFLQSLAVSKSAKTLLNLTIAEKNSGHPVDALRHLRAYFRESAANPNKVAELKKGMFPELYASTAHLQFEVPAGGTITCDGAAVEHLDEEYDVAPEPHVIASLIDGKSEQRSVVGLQGKLVTVSFKSTLAAPTAIAAEPRQAPPPPPPSWWSGRRVAGTAMVGAGVAGGLLGFVLFKSAASSADDDASTLRSSIASAGGNCLAPSTDCTRLEGLIDDRVAANRGATISLLAGAALASVGVVMIALPNSAPAWDRSEARVRIFPGFRSLMLEGAF